MSGAEFLDVVGVISSIITITKTTSEFYDTVKNQRGLPEAFSVVVGQIAIVRKILEKAKQHIDAQRNEQQCMEIRSVIESCGKYAKTLKDIFEKVKPKDGAWKIEQYYKAVKAHGKETRVETLMVIILTNIQLLDSQLGLDQQQEIIDAIKDLNKVQPSVPDSEFQEPGFTMNQFGSGTQHAQYTAKGNVYSSGGWQAIHC